MWQRDKRFRAATKRGGRGTSGASIPQIQTISDWWEEGNCLILVSLAGWAFGSQPVISCAKPDPAGEGLQPYLVLYNLDYIIHILLSVTKGPGAVLGLEVWL